MNKKLVAMMALFAVVQVASAATLKNDGFETGGFNEWQMAGDGWRISAFKPDAYRGRYGAVNDVPIGGGGEYRIIHQTIKCAPGKTYEAGVWVRAVSVENTESFLEIQFLDKEGAVLKQFQSRRVKADQDFVLLTIENALAPDKTSAVSVRGIVYVSKPPELDPDFHVFDNFNFRRARN